MIKERIGFNGGGVLTILGLSIGLIACGGNGDRGSDDTSSEVDTGPVIDTSVDTETDSWDFVDCFPGNVVIHNAKELDEILEFDCIDGNLTVRDYPADEAEDFQLPNLKIINGYLWFYRSHLPDLSGLSTVETILGDFKVVEDNGLVSLDGMTNLVTIERDLKLIDNPTLETIGGLNGVTSLDNVVVYGNAKLTALDGLAALKTVYGDIFIGGENDPYDLWVLNPIDANPLLADLSGLDGLENFDGAVAIGNTLAPRLPDFSGATIIRNLTLRRNPELTSLIGLENVTAIEGDLVIERAAKVSTLAALSNVESILGEIYIYETAITDLTGLGNITESALFSVGANSSMTSLTGVALEEVDGALKIWSNSALVTLAGLENLTTVYGSLTVSGSPLLNSLAVLSNLSYVGGFATISDLGEITSLAGLGNLATVNGTVSITKNAKLADLSGLGLSVESGDFSGDITISNNPLLLSLDILNGVTALDGRLIISDNKSLPNLNDLTSLTSIGSSLRIEDNDNYTEELDTDGPPSSMTGLSSLQGLANLSIIGGDLRVKDISRITDFTGLENLGSVGTDLNISWCGELTSVVGLGTATFQVADEVLFEENEKLPYCQICSFQGGLDAQGFEGTYSISNNFADGCFDTDAETINCP